MTITTEAKSTHPSLFSESGNVRNTRKVRDLFSVQRILGPRAQITELEETALESETLLETRREVGGDCSWLLLC